MSIAKSPTKDGKKITITFYIKKEAAAGADKIFLICEHNGWEPVAMKPQKNGTFRGSITVPTDIQPSYQYRFKYIMNDGEVKFDNDWDAPVAMKPQKNGTFRGSITVPTDIQPSYQYRFKYIMNDGEVKFDNDWDAESYCRNDFGTENSVFTVQQK